MTTTNGTTLSPDPDEPSATHVFEITKQFLLRDIRAAAMNLVVAADAAEPYCSDLAVEIVELSFRITGQVEQLLKRPLPPR